MRRRAKPVNVCVEFGGKIRNFSQLLKAFKRAVKEDGVLKDCKDRHKNPRTRGQKKRDKVSRGKLRQSRKVKRKKV